MRNLQVALALMTVLPLGCAMAPRQEFTGFLGDYTEFKPYAPLPGAFEYWAPDAGQSKYLSILLDPIEVHFAREKDTDPPTAERVTAFKQFVEDELKTAISRHHPIASQPASNVARLRLQISNIRLLKQLPSTPSYTHLPRYRLGSANIEAELADSGDVPRCRCFPARFRGPASSIPVAPQDPTRPVPRGK